MGEPMEVKLNNMIQWAFQSVVAGGIIYGVGVIGDLEDSVNALNQNVAIVVERTAWQQKEIDKLDLRLNKLEGASPSR